MKIVCGIWVVVWGTVLASSGAAFVVNGNFETDVIGANNTVTNITGWTGNESGGALRIDVNTAEIPGSPNQVVRMTGNKWIRQDVSGSWTSNDVFTFSFNACEVPWKSGTAGNNLWAMLRDPSNNTKFFAVQVALDGTHGGSGTTYPAWQTNQTFRFEIPAYQLIDGSAAGSTGNAVEGQALRIYFYTTTNGNSINWLDNVLLTTAYGGPPPTLKPASPFQDGMVLQRGKPVAVWGTADPTNAVTVSINGTHAAGVADRSGNWSVQLPALAAGGPYELQIVSGSQTNTLSDVLVGDVWITFGQSNMVRPLSEMNNKTAYINDIQTNRMIRCLKITQAAATSPQNEGAMTWLDNSNPGSWTSVGSVFAEQMHQAGGVPTAIIWAAWGSSSIEGWMPIRMTNDFPHFEARMQDFYANDLATVEAMLNGTQTYDDVYIRTRPNIIYNQMIHPLLKFGISGFVWYQGEANASSAVDAAQYGFTLPGFVKEYRALFGQGNLPFLGVQLPSYNRTYWPWFRESQSRATAQSNAYVAVTIDTGDPSNIHPFDKEPIGRRLALLGRKYALGESIEAHGPAFAAMSIAGSQVTIAFSHADGLTTDDALDPAEFELAGSDQVWHAATSSAVSGTHVVISSGSVAAPVAVRYAWSPAPVNTVNLINGAGLPAAPFRTDNWPMPGLGAQAPQAVKDSYAVFTNQTLNVPVPGILENDLDLNRDVLAASLVSDVSYGTLTLSSDGSFSYTADSGFAGYDAFSYAASDGSLSGTATVTIVVQPATLAAGYSDTFDRDGLAVNLGKGGGLINKTWYGPAWIDDGNLTAPTSSQGWYRSLVYSAFSYPVTNGFILDVVYDISKTSISGSERTTATFGLVSDEAAKEDMDFLFSREANLYGIGMSLTEGLTDGIGVQGLHTDTGALTPLSNAQGVAPGTNVAFRLTVQPDGSWSYSIDGAAATTGTNLVLDLNKSYRFAAFVRQDPGFVIHSVSFAPIVPVSEIGSVGFGILPGGTELGFSWYGDAGATYGLERTDNLVTGIWETVTNVAGANAVISLSDGMDKTNAFYRIFLSTFK